MPSPPTSQAFAVAIVVFAGVIGIAYHSRRWTTHPGRVGGWLSGPWAPVVAGILTTAAVRFVWGSFDAPGVIHDEHAYLLQAQIFAAGRWTAASPPLAAFFEQMHVFVEPAVFAKYPPGHALMLVPGIWLRLPGLMPALLTGISGSLVFWIARRLSNEWVALLTWWPWTTAGATLFWSSSYLSETTSLTMWLAATWATIRWIDSGCGTFLSLAAVAMAWGLITRPLTMAGLALPLAFVILRRHAASRSWRPLVVPVLVGAAILALVPVWNERTLGDWRRDPYSQYSRVYFPFDKPGFGVDASPPLRTVPPIMAAVGDWSRELHEKHLVTSLPAALVLRVVAILAWFADGWRVVLGALVLAAMLYGSAIERLALVPAAILLLAYLSFAHPPMWIVYYFEALPILYYLAACQLGRLFRKFGIEGETGTHWPASMANASIATAMLLLPLGVMDVIRVRTAVDERDLFNRTARAAIESIPSGRAIVFVRYAPGHDPHRAITHNEAELESAERWIVQDRGASNAELQALAPDRAAYLFDTATFSVERLPIPPRQPPDTQ
jgi:hypothetical protein